ncbi:MAG: TonB-dependent receptor [bacterium]
MKAFLKFIIIFLVVLWIATDPVSAQVLTGTVSERDAAGHKSALPGVNIFWIGTTKGTFSDEKGKFRLSRDGIDDNRVVVSMMGYRKDTLKIARDKSKMDIELVPDKQNLSEVEIKDRQENSFISKLRAQQTQMITTGELQRAACCNLAESFETNPSVDVSYSDALTGAKQIQLLGLSGNYSQVMTESVPMLRGLATPFGLNYIPGPWMESIQISKGAASVVNGYESITGQINVEYKKPENSEKFYLNLFANSNLRLEANANGSIRITDKLSTMLLVHVDNFSYKFDHNSDGFMDIPRLTTFNIFNRWDYINPGKWVSKFGIKYLDENRNGGQMTFDKSTWNTDTTGISNDVKKYGIGVRTKRAEAFWKNGIFLKNHPESSFGLILSGVYHDQSAFYGINTYNGLERSLYANLIFTTDVKNPNHKISAGFSYLLDDFRENYKQTQLTYWYQVNPDSSLFKLFDSTIVNYVRNRTEWVPGAFFEYTLNVKDKFTMIAGVRVDYNSLYGWDFTPRLHLKYKFNETTYLRASVGKGYRTTNVFAENTGLFVSQRALFFVEELKQEEAWNFGINFTKEFKLFKNKAEFSIDAYRTSFVNQVVVDIDSLPTAAFFYNLNGKSYANSIQAQFTFEPVKRFLVTLAFRYNDVKITENGQLREKTFVSQYKGLVTLSYATRFEKWKFDLTGQFNGPQRMPDTDKMPSFLQRPQYSPLFFQLLAQVTKRFKYIDIYLGGENLTNFTQSDPISEYWRPYHTHFDGSMGWGPIVGITIYAGIRLTIK